MATLPIFSPSLLRYDEKEEEVAVLTFAVRRGRYPEINLAQI